MPRTKLIAANWKMYKTPDQTRDFFRGFLPLVSGHERDEIVVCPPYVDLAAAMEAAKGANIAVGAQNLHWKEVGAFTGEISAPMLLSLGVTHGIVGHSERRQYFGETDDTVNLRLKAALEAGLTPICCVGEVLEEREAGLTDEWGPSAREKPPLQSSRPRLMRSSAARPAKCSERNSPPICVFCTED